MAQGADEKLRKIAMAAPDISEADVQAVAEVVRSGRLALGPKTEEFERKMADYVGVAHAVAVSSGTAALHLIVRALGIGPGDEVLVPSFTFAASVNAILYEGAKPVFVDIEPDTYNLSPQDLEAKITPRTKAVMAVDVFGHPVEWDEILPVAEKHGLKVIDDSCEALGARYKGEMVGRFGDAAAFAFYPNKQMTTGEGGIIVTNDSELAALARSLRNQGRGSMGAWLEHERLGYNYRLNEMSAALGVTQLARIDRLLARRRQVAEAYNEVLAGVEGLRLPVVRPHAWMSWFVYVVTLEPGLDSEALMRYLQERGVPTRAYFSPIHQQPYVRKILGDDHELPNTEAIAGRTLALPFGPHLERDDVDYVAQALREAIDEQLG